MSKVLSLGKDRFGEFVAALRAGYRVYGPVERDGVTRFAELGPDDPVRLDLAGTDIPPKDIFFPQAETMLTGDAGEAEATPGPDRPVAVVGIRPCDARSLLMLDKVFGGGGRVDPFWARRFRDALVVSAGCDTPRAGCFCNWLGSGPFGTEGSDIALSDIGDAVLLEPVSERGAGFLRGVGLEEASAEELARAAGVRKRAEAAMAGPADLSPLKETLDRSWDSPLWGELAATCLSCAACAYLCPTCHCFDVQDERLPGAAGFRRVRIWDSCMFPLFTKEASGHNPRPTGTARLRQRVMHKFNYFVEVHAEPACVGCGRCVRACPVNVDIREVLARFINAG